MSELAAVKETPADMEAPTGGGDGEIEQLDEEATALLKELEDSQLEVQRMLAEQRVQAQELGGIKDHLSAELLQLRDDAWKLHLFAELEMLKRQLAAINSLDADLDAMEAKLDAEEVAQDDDSLRDALAAAQAGTRDMLSRLGMPGSKPTGPGAAAEAPSDGAPVGPSAASTAPAGSSDAEGAAGAGEGDGKEEEEEEVEDVEALQDELDAELAAMMQQLQAIKAESAMVAARKAQLELELMQLMKDEADDLSSQLRDLGVGGEEAGAPPPEEAEEEGGSVSDASAAAAAGAGAKAAATEPPAGDAATPPPGTGGSTMEAEETISS